MLTGDRGVHQQNLAPIGFGPSTDRRMFAKLFPGGKIPAGFSEITRDDLTEGKINSARCSFPARSSPDGRPRAQPKRSAHFAKMSGRGEVVQQVATAYLHAIAAYQ
jgi:hypothetical protein